MTGYCLPGPAALPEFQLGKRLSRLRQELPSVTGLAASAAYFVDSAAPLPDEDLAALARLLDADLPASFRASDRSPGPLSPIAAIGIGGVGGAAQRPRTGLARESGASG